MKKYIYIVVLITLGTSCNDNMQKKQEIKEHHTTGKKEDKSKIIISKLQFDEGKMKLGTISKQIFQKIIPATGVINIPPTSKEIITSFYGGSISKSTLLVGDKVHKGQALIVIENPMFIDIQQEYLQIKEQLSYLESEYQRQETLYKEKISSKKKYLSAKSEFKSKKSKLYGLEKKLNMLNIDVNNVVKGIFKSTVILYSSMDGIVSKVNISKGMHVEPEYKMLEIINTNHIHVELLVFENDIMKITKGQKIRFKIPESSSTYYGAEVYLIEKVIDEKIRAFRVHAHLDKNGKNIFNIGMFVDAEIIISNVEKQAVPEKSIIEHDGLFFVLKLKKSTKDDYVFEYEKVDVGQIYDGFLEVITSNISDADSIMIDGVYMLE